jgi:phosphoribosylaminoimidazolecarboxamide formyltransferase / IMP cyclohydrolase
LATGSHNLRETRMPRAIVSVSNTEGLVTLCAALGELGWELVASGGTERHLRDAGITVTPVEQVTGMPSMLGGRVKTLHPAIHAGILTRDDEADAAEMMTHGFAPFDMIICNLYPFQETVGQPQVTIQDAIEHIDIGGVALLRGGAKNFMRVTTVCDPDDYGRVLAELRASGLIELATRRYLAVKAFATTRDYDTAIHSFLSPDIGISALGLDALPNQLSIGLHLVEDLRYGENPHQAAGYYGYTGDQRPLGARQMNGKPLSYNNILDLDAAWRAVSAWGSPAVAIVKHLAPIGIATADTVAEAFNLALASDPVSAFGGAIAVNREVDDALVDALGSLFIEIIAAPGFSASARARLADSRKNCRLLQMPQSYRLRDLAMRSVMGGLLVQQQDQGDPEGTIFRTVTERSATPDELNAARFAWDVVRFVPSNAIVVAHDGYTVGIGGGLPSRIDAANLAIAKAGERARGAALASDAFFPFPDAIEVAARAGIGAIIQPGGSIRDAEVIAAANAADIAMLFTGTRHFRH